MAWKSQRKDGDDKGENMCRQEFDKAMTREFGDLFTHYTGMCELHGNTHYPERLSEEDQPTGISGQLISDSPNSDGNAESEE